MKSNTKAVKGKMEKAMNYLHVRAHFVKRNSSLAKWAKRNGFGDDLVYLAVKGKRSGPTARKILRALEKELAA